MNYNPVSSSLSPVYHMTDNSDNTTILFQGPLTNIINDTTASVFLSSNLFESVNNNATIHLSILPPVLPNDSFTFDISPPQSVPFTSIFITIITKETEIAAQASRKTQLTRYQIITATAFFSLCGVFGLIVIYLIVRIINNFRRIKIEKEILEVRIAERKILEASVQQRIALKNLEQNSEDAAALKDDESSSAPIESSSSSSFGTTPLPDNLAPPSDYPESDNTELFSLDEAKKIS